MDAILPIAALAALFAAYLVSKGNWIGFAIWIVTDLIFMVNNYMICQWEQCILFALYLGIAANGVYYWKFKREV